MCRRGDEELKFIDSDNIPELLNHAYQYCYIYWIFLKVLIETGIRKGEAATLQWNDINLKEKTISISKSMDFQPGENGEIFGDTKNRKTRVIDIADTSVNALKTHFNSQN